MAEESAKLRIPYIAAAQAQKHVTHNEAMTLLDTLVQLSVLDKDLNTPPGSPVEGDTYIVASGGTGAWIGWDKRIARFIDGTWRSYLAGAGNGAGWLAWVMDEGAMYRFDGTSWALAGIEGPEGPEGPQGPPGDPGPTGATGADGADPGILLTWDTGTADADPGAGKIRADNASLASATQLFISKTSRGGSDIAAFLAALDDSTNTAKGTLVLTNPATEAQAAFLTGAATDATGYVKLAVSGHSGATAFGDGAPISFQFSRAGDKGADGMGAGDVTAAANIADGALVVGDGGAKGIKGHASGAPGALAFKNTAGTGDIDNNAVTYAKMQDVSATDRLLGRASAGAGDPEEIICTAAGRALLDDASAAAQRATLGLDKEAIEFVIDGGGQVITTGVKGDLIIPFACTITKATLLADQSGSIVVDVWKDSYANFPPTNADSITAAAKPTISSASKSQDATLSGWTTAIAAGDILRFNVNSVTSIQRVTLILEVTK